MASVIRLRCLTWDAMIGMRTPKLPAIADACRKKHSQCKKLYVAVLAFHLGLSLTFDNVLRIDLGLLYLILNIVCLFHNLCYGGPLVNQQR